MLALLTRLHTARINRLAATVRRHHAILRRPQFGRLILEAMGVAPRLLTLRAWSPMTRIPVLRPSLERGPAPVARARPALRWPRWSALDRFETVAAAERSFERGDSPSPPAFDATEMPNAEALPADAIELLEAEAGPAMIAEAVAPPASQPDSAPAGPSVSEAPRPIPAAERATEVARIVAALDPPPRGEARVPSSAVPSPRQPSAAPQPPGSTPPTDPQREVRREAGQTPVDEPGAREIAAALRAEPDLASESATAEPDPLARAIPGPAPAETVAPAAEPQTRVPASVGPTLEPFTLPSVGKVAAAGSLPTPVPDSIPATPRQDVVARPPAESAAGSPEPASIGRTETAPVSPPATDVVSEPTPSHTWKPIEERRARPPGVRPQPVESREPPMPAAAQVTPAPEIAETVERQGQSEEAPPPATPLEWLARLQRAYGGQEAEQSRAARKSAPAGEPVSFENRRVLEPLVGADAGSVRVHRGPAPAKLASRLRADALTVGDQIVLGEGRQERDPETVGLLAHELVHVARQRNPRFVPPVISGRRDAARGPQVPTLRPVTAPRPGAPSASRPPAHPVREPPRGPRTPGVDPSEPEETLAVEVEAVATSAAREQRRAPQPSTEITRAPTEGPATGPVVEGDVRRWGSLPAPWEPLPDFLMGPVGSPEAESGPPGVAPSAAFPATAAVPAVRLAPSDRQVPEERAPGAEAGASPAGSKPDLDLLARQVYAVLKRRLEGERRRSM